jgi:O-antigen ligase
VSIAPGISRRTRAGSIAAAAVTAAALMLTQTRSSWLAMFVSSAVIFAFARKRWLPAFLAIVTAAVFVAPAQYRERITSMFDPGFRTNVQRVNMIKGGLSIYREHPVIGAGPVDLGEIYREHMPEGAVHVHGHMHNIFVQVAATLGTLGLAAFVWLLSSMAVTIGKNLRLDLPPPDMALVAGSIGALAGFIVNGLFDWNFGDAEVLTMMLIIVGLNAGIFRGSGAAGRGAPEPEPGT